MLSEKELGKSDGKRDRLASEADGPYLLTDITIDLRFVRVDTRDHNELLSRVSGKLAPSSVISKSISPEHEIM